MVCIWCVGKALKVYPKLYTNRIVGCTLTSGAGRRLRPTAPLVLHMRCGTLEDAAAQPARLAKLCLALGDGDVADEALPVRVERGARRVGRQLGPHLVAAARLAGEGGTW